MDSLNNLSTIVTVDDDEIAESQMMERMESTPAVQKKGRRGRKPSKVDVKTKLERSRQSARECRARKKLRYQYVEDLVVSREKAIFALRSELETYKKWSLNLDGDTIPPEVIKFVKDSCEDVKSHHYNEETDMDIPAD